MINLTLGNNKLARLQTLKGSANGYANIMLRNLPKSLAGELTQALALISDFELTQETSIISIKFGQDGTFQRAYAPQLHNDGEGGLAIKLGRELVKLDLSKTENLDIELQELKLDKYEDPTLVITYEVQEDEFISLPLPLRLTKEAYESFDFLKTKVHVKKGKFDKLAELLQTPKLGGSSGSAPMINITELDEYVPIKVTKARSVNASYGVSYIINIIKDEQECQMWAPYQIKELLNLGAQISEDTSFTYYSYKNKQDKIRQKVSVEGLLWETGEDELDLDDIAI